MDSQWSNSPFIFDLLASGRLVLPNLRRCTLHELTSREYVGPNALACLKLPSLVELEMSFGQDDGDGWCFLRDGGGHFINSIFGERIADFLRGSKSTLQQVTIARVCFVDGGRRSLRHSQRPSCTHRSDAPRCCLWCRVFRKSISTGVPPQATQLQYLRPCRYHR
ncbi:hypothetical protein FA13DRAFT_594040 [Coprinellus micaceus]|uniref:Uncharacterized protein n=1 Tax=Coprinellus micaceus TaxID=71717 RepID=A0A4Y7SAE6_COPMI|nr:hypothetical protein FA13DRAFT_594040 [Coprinellus micaceus]